MENVLEEIVGEIRDEFEQTSARVLDRDGRGGLTVRGDLLLEQLAEELSLEFDLEGVPVCTVGGLILHLLGRSATLEDQVDFKGLRMTVRDLRRLRISVVQVETLSDD
jgi:CBS domain containing-hemolysin-like protein